MTSTNLATPAPDREIVSSRTLDATPEAIWAAFADPDRLARWWGPAGFTNTFHHFDFRPGGEWRFTMHGPLPQLPRSPAASPSAPVAPAPAAPPDIRDFPNHSVFVELVQPRRIVLDHIVAPIFRAILTFERTGDRTRIDWLMRFDAAEVCAALKPICVPCNEQNFDRLEAELRGHR